jgi:Fe-S-cluster containining protein
MAEITEEMRDPRSVALALLKAISLSDGQVFREMDAPRYTTIDYYRMACHILFQCRRCGSCCTTGDPIRLRREDAREMARHLKIPLNKFIKKYANPDPDRPEVLNFKHILPCKFYDARREGCKIYSVRPWSCRIFPFLGVYGCEEQVVVKQSCPGSVETMNILTTALETVRMELKECGPFSLEEVRQAKIFLRQALDAL